MSEAPSNASIAAGWVHGGWVRSEFTTSLLECAGLYEHFLSVGPSPYVARQRNDLASMFLDATDSEWLWMLDTDQIWNRDCLIQLLAKAEEEKAGVCGAVYIGRHHDGSRFVVGGRWDEEERELVEPSDPGEIAAVGMGFTLIRRKVIEDLFDTTSRPFEEGHFDTGHDLIEVGEDTMFCLRAHSIGHKIHLADVRVGHVKEIVL